MAVISVTGKNDNKKRNRKRKLQNEKNKRARKNPMKQQRTHTNSYEENKIQWKFIGFSSE